MKNLAVRLGLFGLMTISGAAHAEWPTQWSGSLPRPTLMVHGINANMTTWGASFAKICNIPPCTMKLPLPDDFTGTSNVANSIAFFSNGEIDPGWVLYYTQNSAADKLANLYGLSKVNNTLSIANGSATLSNSWDVFNPSKTEGINHNGLEFYNFTGSKEKFEPAANPLSIEIQADRLYRRIEAVLDEYYTSGNGDTWRYGIGAPSKQIDLVAHSQGGIIIRKMIDKYRDEYDYNVVNHIRSIVTINTPYTGTALMTNHSHVAAVDNLMGDISWLKKQGAFNPLSANIDPFKSLRELVTYVQPMAKTELSYPSGFKYANYLPYSSVMRTDSNADTSTNHSALLTTLNAKGFPTRPSDKAKIPLTALYSTAPGAGKRIADGIGNLITQQFKLPILNGKVIIDASSAAWPFHVLLGTLRPKLEALDNEWTQYSDLVVDVSSQRADGLFSPDTGPFIAKELNSSKLNPNALGAPHMTLPFAGENNNGVFWGGATYALDIKQALENLPRGTLAKSCLQPVRFANGTTVKPYFDSVNCSISQIPAGTTPFIWFNQHYVGGYNGTCPIIGEWDGANCRITDPMPAGSGSTAFLWGSTLYHTPQTAEFMKTSLWNGVKAFFPFDEKNTGNVVNFAKDPIGNNTGSGVQAPTAGVVKNGIALSGNNHVTVPNNSNGSLNFGTSNFSIDTWIKTTDTDGIIVAKRNYIAKTATIPEQANGYIFMISGGKLLLQMGSGASAYNYYTSAAAGITDGKWHHVAVTVARSSTTGGRIYVDGKPMLMHKATLPLVNTFDPTYRSGSLDTTASLSIGRDSATNLSNANYLAGSLDELTLYNRALSSADVAKIVSLGAAGKQ